MYTDFDDMMNNDLCNYLFFNNHDIRDNNEKTDYNLIDTSTDENKSYTIEINVAGYTKNDIKVTLKDSRISVELPFKEEKKYIVHGITQTRKYSFKLNKYIILNEVKLENGILSLYLVKEIPEEEKTKVFEIK